jgi:hypothetical protein
LFRSTYICTHVMQEWIVTKVYILRYCSIFRSSKYLVMMSIKVNWHPFMHHPLEALLWLKFSPYMSPIDLIYGFTLVSHFERSGSYMSHISQKKSDYYVFKGNLYLVCKGFFHTYLDYLFCK